MKRELDPFCFGKWSTKDDWCEDCLCSGRCKTFTNDKYQGSYGPDKITALPIIKNGSVSEDKNNG